MTTTWLDDILGLREVAADAAPPVARRKRMRFKAGTGITLALADDPTDGESELTIASTGGSSVVADGTTLAQIGSTLSIATGGVGTTQIANDAVTYAKMQNVSAASRVLGRGSAAGAGDVDELTVGGGLEFVGTLVQIAAAGVTLAKLANGSGTSVVGRSPSTAGQHSDIQALADGHVLRRSGGTLEFGLLDFSSIGGTVPLNQLENLTAPALLGRVTAGLGQVEALGIGASLAFVGSQLVREAISGDITIAQNSNTAAIAAGAIVDADVNAAAAIAFSKLATITTDTLLGRDTAGTGALEPITLNATLSMTGSGALQRAALTGDVTAAAGSNTTAIAAGVIVNADVNASAAIAHSKLATLAGLSVLGNGTNATASMAAITGTAGQILRISGTTLGFGAIDVGDPASVTGELQYANLPSAVGLSIIGRGASSSGVVGQIAGSANQVLRVTADGTALGFGTITGAAIGSNEVTLVKLEQLAGYSLIGRAGTTTGNVAAITATADGQVMTRTVGGLAWGTTIGSSSTAFIVNGNGVTIQSAGVAVLHAVTLSSGREILGIHGTVTTTQMPANTGDKVTFIAAATTAPAADGSPNATPSGGCIVYTNSAGEFVTVSTDTSTVLPAMKLGDGTRRLDIKAGGAVDGNIYLSVIGGATHKVSSNAVDFFSNSVGSDQNFSLSYGGTSFIRTTHATLGGTPQMSFFGVAPVAKAADPGALAVSVGTADGTIADVGASFNQATLNNNFRDLADKYNTLRTLLRNYGLAA